MNLAHHVPQIHSGAVVSKLGANQPAFTLPASSYYNILKSVIEPFLTADYVNQHMIPADKYADQVVKNALRSSPNLRPWTGGKASLNCFFSTFFGHWFYVSSGFLVL